LVVSTGPAPTMVPNIVGSTQSSATTAITGAGLVLGTVTSQSSATVASGEVISETPSAGTSVAAGSSVNLVVSTGPAASSGGGTASSSGGGGGALDWLTLLGLMALVTMGARRRAAINPRPGLPVLRASPACHVTLVNPLGIYKG
jgi:hypothetical protein